MAIGAQDFGILTTRSNTLTLIDNIQFNDVVTSYNSASIDVSEFKNMALYINNVVASTPTRLNINMEFSDDEITWYKLMNGAFANIRYVAASGNKLEAIEGPLRGKYCRLNVTAEGTNATKTFTLTCKVYIS